MNRNAVASPNLASECRNWQPDRLPVGGPKSVAVIRPQARRTRRAHQECITITANDPNPNINWKNFIVGQPLFLQIKGAGKNSLKFLIDETLREGVKLHLAMPAKTHELLVQGADRQVKGFKLVDAKKARAGTFARAALPFPELVILSHEGPENFLGFGPMTEGHFSAMSLGIEFTSAKLKHGTTGTTLPTWSLDCFASLAMTWKGQRKTHSVIARSPATKQSSLPV